MVFRTPVATSYGLYERSRTADISLRRAALCPSELHRDEAAYGSRTRRRLSLPNLALRVLRSMAGEEGFEPSITDFRGPRIAALLLANRIW
jgi:hypothetical protein